MIDLSENRLNGRIVNKHDTEANWLKTTNFIPMLGEMIIYDPDDIYTYSRQKIGDGVTNVNDLPFANVQSDWNENDETSTAYVQNRTHYSHSEEVVLYEGTISDRIIYGSFGGNEVSVENANGYEEYIAIIDGIEYRSKKKTDETLGVTYLGNLSGYESSAENTGESYVLVLENDAIIAAFNVGGSHSLKLTAINETIYPIDEKYIPDTITRSSDIREKLLPDVTAEDAGKFLCVNDTGAWAAQEIPNAEATAF